MSGLPKERTARVDWVLSAKTPKETRNRYDTWAPQYDMDLTEVDGWLGPTYAAREVARKLVPSARILDAGCGTGLSGEALRSAGFDHLTGVDFSEGMLAVARQKNVFESLKQADLGKSLDFVEDQFDAVVTVGTSFQMPAESYREFARITRPGGWIFYCGDFQQFDERGFAAICKELCSKGALEEIERTEKFTPLPKSEPDIVYKVIIHRVIS